MDGRGREDEMEWGKEGVRWDKRVEEWGIIGGRVIQVHFYNISMSRNLNSVPCSNYYHKITFLLFSISIFMNFKIKKN